MTDAPDLPARPGAAERRSIVVRCYEYPDSHVVHWHSHARGQLIFAAAGVMEVVVLDGMFLVPPQRAVWIPPNVRHQMRARGHVALRTVYVAPERSPIPGDETVAVQVSGLLRELILRGAALSADDDRSRRADQAFELLWTEIAGARDTTIVLPMARDPRLVKLCQALLADLGDPRDLHDWAGVVGASTRTLTRLFHAQLGMSFVTWRQQLRVMVAIPRLASGDRVSAVAADLGYETPSAFAAIFRRITGQSPSIYGQSTEGPGE